MRKINILHITPHLGGGVGRVLLNYLLKAKKSLYFEHKIASLDYANGNAINMAKDAGLKLSGKISGDKQLLLEMITRADIVLIHHWNHPLLYDLLVRTQLPPCRMIIWSHVSGLYPPYVFTEKVLLYPDLFVFTTPVSLQAKEVQNLSEEQRKHIRAIWATAGVEHVRSVKPKAHSGFNAGYIGTVDYAKLHPDFLTICDKIDIPDVRFIVCGGQSEKEIKKEAEKRNIAKKFNFIGPVSDITKYLNIFDVFGYPLARYHYGTCDQALTESMAAGVVPVVFANPMESHMIKNRSTGIVAKNKYEYIKAVEDLYRDHRLRKTLSKNAKKYAVRMFSLERMISDWDKVYNEVLRFPKIGRNWQIDKSCGDISPKDVFLEALGCYGKAFVSYCAAKNYEEKSVAIKKIVKLAGSPSWQSETKGSVHQYNSFFPEDKYLSYWSKLMKGSIR